MGVREQRLVFGEDAELYDRARPSYPPALLDDVAGLVGTPARTLDVGCGTGKATVPLARRGLGGVAVEADPSMAAVARRNLAPHPGWRVEVSDFEAWQPGDRLAPFDLVCSAQAWHWIDPEVRYAKAHSLLRPGGWLALWWNRPVEEETPLRAAMEEAYESLAPELPARGIGPRGIGTRGTATVEAVPAGLAFAEVLRRSYSWSQRYTAAEWTALLRTQSDHRLMEPRRREALLGEVGRLIEDHGDVYTHPYVSLLWAARKAPRA